MIISGAYFGGADAGIGMAGDLQKVMNQGQFGCKMRLLGGPLSGRRTKEGLDSRRRDRMLDLCP